MRRRRFIPVAALATLFLLALGGSPLLAADEAGGASWGGFDYRQAAEQNRYLVKAKLLEAPAPNMEPAIPHPGQIQESINRLQAKGFCAEVLARSCKSCRFDPAREKGCRKPNILIFLVDDMGWGDFGPYGGGLAYGAATPNVNQLAAKGLLLTSTYSQPTCSPSRATIHTGQLPVHHGVLYPPMYGD
nr:sulfatase-like hydrolase/transferase [Thermoanaerobaculia bacterium]